MSLDALERIGLCTAYSSDYLDIEKNTCTCCSLSYTVESLLFQLFIHSLTQSVRLLISISVALELYTVVGFL